MRSAELINQNCSVARPATLLGDPWTLVILRQAFSRVRRFDEFQRHLGISRSLLADRLQTLVEAGILERRPYKDEIRTREEYRLTQKGLDLYPALMALREWGDRYMAEDGPPLSIRHRDCGGEAHVHLSCDRCGEELGARDTEVAPGPGLRSAA
jgi:DNA-binding HxlR family transcriptional regulator